MKTRVTVALTCVLCAALLLAGCAPGVNDQLNTANAGGNVAGFWLGLWHGAIAWATLVISLFNSRVQIYEVHNSGGGYNFGFLIGAQIAAVGGAALNRRARRRAQRTP